MTYPVYFVAIPGSDLRNNAMMATTMTQASKCSASLKMRTVRARQPGGTSSSSSNTDVTEPGGVKSSIGGSKKRDCRAVVVVTAVGGGERFSGGGRVPRAMMLGDLLLKERVSFEGVRVSEAKMLGPSRLSTSRRRFLRVL